MYNRGLSGAVGMRDAGRCESAVSRSDRGLAILTLFVLSYNFIVQSYNERQIDRPAVAGRRGQTSSMIRMRKKTSASETASVLSDTSVVPARRMPVGRPAQPDRRLAILLAGEKLFATRGYDGVSIRDIAGEAEVPIALVGYYYGNKRGLYYAIFESWRGSIEQRLDGLRRACEDPKAPDLLERIIDAYVSPVVALHHSVEGQYFASMAARDLVAASPDTDEVQREFFDPLAKAFIDALMAVFPHATRGQIVWCYQFALGAMLYYLLSTERSGRLSGGENTKADPAGKELLVDFITSGFRGALTVAKPKAAPRKKA